MADLDFPHVQIAGIEFNLLQNNPGFSLHQQRRQWLCWNAASGLERILCGVLVKRTLGKHGWVHWSPLYT